MRKTGGGRVRLSRSERAPQRPHSAASSTAPTATELRPVLSDRMHPAAAHPPQPGFALSAVGFDSYFRYDVTPGSSKTGTVQVSNLSERP